MATLLLILLFAGNGCIERDITGALRGSFYANDCGEPRGGFEWAGDYYANITLNKGFGKLIIEFKIGLGDPLEKHEYSVVLQTYTTDYISIMINGKKVILEWVENDTIWNTWHNYYIARYGINMDENDIIGAIQPIIFPGLYIHYYVELRLPKIY